MESAHGVSLQISRASRPGRSVIDLGAGRFTADLSAPNYLVAPPDHACTYNLTSDIDLLVVEFSSKIFWDDPWRLQDCGPLYHGARYDTLPLLLAEQLWELSAHGLTQLEADSLGMALATLLARASQPAFGMKPAKGGLIPKELKLLTEYMKGQLASDLSLAELAALVSRSPYHFARAFKVSTGVPPCPRVRLNARCCGRSARVYFSVCRRVAKPSAYPFSSGIGKHSGHCFGSHDLAHDHAARRSADA
ncbi:AraC-like DNA-binding protein [Bradyrhizobium sp. AZCC 2262]|uniref:hypothetical protein n=1 Tax=Bradyrhizobium sp. AZCC 2262 TaxID=3117022 RepID=UPI002FF3624F